MVFCVTLCGNWTLKKQDGKSIDAFDVRDESSNKSTP